MKDHLKYRIKVDYATGSSFGSEDTFDFLELSWNNLEIAKENLKAIQDHYSALRYLNSWSSKKRTIEEIVEENKDKFWLVRSYKNWDSENSKLKKQNPKIDEYSVEHLIRLKTDEGRMMQLSCFWIGYFESLYGAEIVEDNSDLSFTV